MFDASTLEIAKKSAPVRQFSSNWRSEIMTLLANGRCIWHDFEDDDEDENDFDDFHRFAGFRKMCRTDNISSRLARSSLLRRKGLFENIQL